MAKNQQCSGSLLTCKLFAVISMIENLALGIADVTLVYYVCNDPTMKASMLELVNAGYVGIVQMLALLWAVMLLLAVMGFGFGLLLFKGAHERNVHYLRIWILFSTMYLFALIFITLVVYDLLSSNNFWLLIASMVLDGLIIIVVFVEKAEIEGSFTV